MSLQNLLKNVDKGFYRDINKEQTVIARFAALAEENGCAPSEKEWAVRERRYFKRYGLPTNDDDPDFFSFRAEAVRNFAFNTYALEKAFESLGMPLRGRKAPTIEKVFAVGTSQTLFPIFFESMVVAGILASSLVPQLVAQEEVIDSHSADHVALTDTAPDRTTSHTNEGAILPSIEVKTAERAIKLEKFGIQWNVTYEAMRLRRIDVVGRFIQRVGVQIGIDETDELIEVAIAGDGNTSSAATVTNVDASGVLDYDEIIKLYQLFDIGYEFRKAVINDAHMRMLLNLAEFKDPLAGFNFQRTGQMIQPVGATWYRWKSTGSSSFGTDRILALDDRYALIQYTEGGVITETDRLIDRQWEKSTVSKWTGFGKLDYNATQVLDVVP